MESHGELFEERLVLEVAEFWFFVGAVGDGLEGTFNIVRCEGVRDDDRRVRRFGRQPPKGLFVEVPGRLHSAGALIEPYRDRGIASPAAVDRADREVNAIEVNLRAQYGRAADVSADGDVDRRVVDGIG